MAIKVLLLLGCIPGACVASTTTPTPNETTVISATTESAPGTTTVISATTEPAPGTTTVISATTQPAPGTTNKRHSTTVAAAHTTTTECKLKKDSGNYNTLCDEKWYDPSTWNADPKCTAPEPVFIRISGNSSNGTTTTKSACIDYCEFSYPLFMEEQQMRDQVWPIILYIMGVVYTFLAIAIICDEFFVPALERICEKFSIQPDVAGATLMAAGGSAPELATSFVGAFSNSPVGFGTIVGSAVFNVLFVIGACAFASPDTLALTWWPLFRDSTYYMISLLVLAVFFGVISPSRITWYEAIILFVMYVCYVLLMSQSEKLHKIFNKWAKNKKCQKQTTSNSDVQVHPDPADEDAKKEEDVKTTLIDDDASGESTLEKVEGKEDTKEDTNGGEDDDGDDDDDDDDDEPFALEWPQMDDFNPEEIYAEIDTKYKDCTPEEIEKKKSAAKCTMLGKLIGARTYFLISFPLAGLFYVTVPDVRREDSKLCCCTVKWKELWLAGFLFSIMWIGVFSYLMVWWAEVLGLLSTIPSPIVGLTLLAAGTSIPDLVSSVVVARKGEGDMAVSSSIGSNIFDILVGLPLPWLTKSIVNGVTSWGECTDKFNRERPDIFCFSIDVKADTLFFSVLLLIAMIFIVIAIVHCSKWRMTKSLGVSMLILYFLFVVQDILRNCALVPYTAKWFTWLGSGNRYG